MTGQQQRQLQSQLQQMEAQRLQLQHQAEQQREQRLQTALETQDESKQGQRVWIIPEFDPSEAEGEYISQAVREALPEYHCQTFIDTTEPMTKERIHGLAESDGGRDE